MNPHGRIAALVLLSGMLLVGCAWPQPTPEAVDREGAREALTAFLGMLSQGQYAEAAAMYAGPLDSLQGFNPELDPQDAAGLIGYACGQRLLQCLPVRSISPAEEGPAGELTFEVEFSMPDGSLFVLGPCCGATETEMPPLSTFRFRVQPTAGGYGVLDLPPYVP